MERYSVLMSAYSKVVPSELKLSIESMLSQTVPPEQFVLVWDGPVSDELHATVESFIVQYPDLFTVVQLEKNCGLAVALNSGITACRNDLIARMDSDDFSLPFRCEKQLIEFEKNPSLALLGGHTQHFKVTPEEALDVYSKQPIGKKAIEQCIRRNSAFSHPTVMFRKSAVLECGGYDPQLRRSQDHDLFSKMIYQGYDCANLDEAVVMFRADDNCMLRNRNKESCKARVIIQKRLYKRKQCSLMDYLYIRIMVFMMQILPQKLYLKIYSLLKEK